MTDEAIADQTPRTGETVAALILAGGVIAPELLPLAEGATNRALIPLAPGRVMLDYVVAAVRDAFAGTGERILIAGDVPLPAGCIAVPGGESLVDTLLHGVAALHGNETRMLVVTADLPFLTADAVRGFLRLGEAAQPADIIFSIVPAAVCQEGFPTMRRTTLRIREGEFTLGGVSLLSPGFLRNREEVIREAYARRKDKARLAALLGPGLMLRFALAQIIPAALDIPYLEREVGRLLGGATARGVVAPFAGIGVDIDKVADVEIARAELSRIPM
jgi:GTP:adenosylcobinamide-phosphate guanylyltransferase